MNLESSDNFTTVSYTDHLQADGTYRFNADFGKFLIFLLFGVCALFLVIGFINDMLIIWIVLSLSFLGVFLSIVLLLPYSFCIDEHNLTLVRLLSKTTIPIYNIQEIRPGKYKDRFNALKFISNPKSYVFLRKNTGANLLFSPQNRAGFIALIQERIGSTNLLQEHLGYSS